jgi:ribose transport system permease protein
VTAPILSAGTPSLPLRLGIVAWHATRPFRAILFLTFALVVALAVSQHGFATWQNTQNLLTSVSGLWVVSMGMTYVLITAGADLSVGAISALGGIFMAKIVSGGVPGWPAVALTLVFGAVVGAVVNGALIGRLRLSFFVVTLASLTAMTGVVNLWSDTQSFTVAVPAVSEIGVQKLGGLPTLIWIMIGVYLLGSYVLRWTYFGRDVYAAGGSIAAARLSGVRTARTLILTYGISGLCAALAGIIAIGRIGVAAPNVDANLPLEAIAAVLLGGTSLAGGFGSLTGTAIGVLFLGALSNGLSIAGVPSFWQQVVTGVILVLAVLGDHINTLRTWLFGRRRGSEGDESSVDTGALVQPQSVRQDSERPIGSGQADRAVSGRTA